MKFYVKFVFLLHEVFVHYIIQVFIKNLIRIIQKYRGLNEKRSRILSDRGKRVQTTPNFYICRIYVYTIAILEFPNLFGNTKIPICTIVCKLDEERGKRALRIRCCVAII